MAPKKAAKKAAKKLAGKHDPHKAGRDARRAFEHLGRVQAIAALTSTEQESIGLLISVADRVFRSGHPKESADLLRAAEHLSFAAIAEADTGRISSELIVAIEEEFDHLRTRAEEHGSAAEAPKAVRTIYGQMVKNAEKALRQKSYRRALELVRGAEALTHIPHLEENLLNTGETLKRLQGSR